MAAGGRFDIGEVVQRTFRTIGANFVPFFLLGIGATIPSLVSGFLLGAHIAGQSTFSATGIVETLAVGFVSFFFSVVLQAALTYGTVTYQNGQPVSIVRALLIGVREFFPLLAIAILAAIGIFFGIILFIVPGIMLIVMWAVAVPARVVERTGIFESFSRSAELTSGYRWPIFATLLLFFVGSFVLQMLTAPFLAATSTVAAAWILTGVRALISAIIAVLSSTLTACIYYELRSIKEGIGPEQIAAVFE